MFAGLYACIGVLSALRHKERTGQGQQVDIGMLDTHAAWLANQGTNFLATGENPARMGNHHPNIVPYQVFETADGHIMLTIGNDPAFARFCNSFGLEHMPPDPRFATNAARVGNRALVVAAMVPVLRRQSTAWWVERLEDLQIACGPINRLADVFADPQMIARNNVVELDHASGAKVKMIANPVRLSETPADYRRAPPLLGQHTDEVLADWLGLDEAALAALRRDGIV
jgi:crotonobetainyl-CoA:carnitine CoA-transferase CaiB-like acyl-CoA transferase